MQLCKHLKPRPEEHLPSNQPQHQRISPAAIQTCGGKEGRVTVKMTSFGLPSPTVVGTVALSPPLHPQLSRPISSVRTSAKIVSQFDFSHTHSDDVYM